MNPNKFAESFEIEMADIAAAVRDFPWEDADAYANWCAQTYYYVSHSTRLLALCAALTPLGRNDYHYRFAKHLKEESGHENLALKDVASLKFKVDEFPQLPETRAFYQTQYFYIEHVHPFAFFGYIMMLEGAAAKIGPQICARTEKAHGAHCQNFIGVHSEDDQQHIKDAFHLVNKMSPVEIDQVHENFIASCVHYLAIMARCAEFAKQKQKVA